MRARRLFGSFDWSLFTPAMLLPLIGLAIIYSATVGTPTAGAFQRQAMWLVIGLVVLLAAMMIDYHTLAEFAWVLYGFALALLVLTLVFGRVVNNSKSWLGLGGISFQPSEIAKVATILAVAAYLGRAGVRRLGFVNFSAIALLVGLPMILILQQPDLGTAATFVPLLGGAAYLAGIRTRTIVVLALAAALALPLIWTQLQPYQQERIKIVLDPTRDPRGAGYQLIQSKIAVGSGGILGKGFLAGTQGQLQFLPEQHTDFVFAVLAEERGFIGSGLALALYFVIIYRCIAAARVARDRLGIYIATGVACVVGGQTVLNIGVVLGLVPTTGVPLPLMSYGGSSLVSTMAALGLALNVRIRRLVN